LAVLWMTSNISILGCPAKGLSAGKGQDSIEAEFDDEIMEGVR
jgi:hypothetical protein